MYPTSPGHGLRRKKQWSRPTGPDICVKRCVLPTGLQQLLKTAGQVLLEIGPGRTLKTLALQHINRGQAHLVFTSVRDRRDPQSDVAFILDVAGPALDGRRPGRLARILRA